MKSSAARHFRKPEVPVRIGPEALGLPSDSLGVVSRSRSEEVGVRHHSVPTKSAKKNALSVPPDLSLRLPADPFWLERFEAKISPEPNSGCWLWTAAVTSRGYGTFRIADVDFLAHRLSHALWVGPLARGLFVCHRCDNPVCVNPRHLFAGTPLENSRDAKAKGRTLKGNTNAAGPRLREELVIAIRLLRKGGAQVKKLAEDFGVSPSTVTSIVQRRSWTHLPEVGE